MRKSLFFSCSFFNEKLNRVSSSSVIREEGGKMYMEEKQWTLAYNEFFEGFRHYQVCFSCLLCFALLLFTKKNDRKLEMHERPNVSNMSYSANRSAVVDP